MYDKIETNGYAISEGISANDMDLPELEHWALEDFEDLVPQHLR